MGLISVKAFVKRMNANEIHTFLYLQSFTWVDFHLHLPISLILTEPAVTGEHVLQPVHRHPDLDAVQKPTSSQALVSVANQQPVYLQDPPTEEGSLDQYTNTADSFYYMNTKCECCTVRMYEICMKYVYVFYSSYFIIQGATTSHLTQCICG